MLGEPADERRDAMTNPLLSAPVDEPNEPEEDESEETTEGEEESEDALKEKGLAALRAERKRVRELQADIRKLKAANASTDGDKVRDEIRAEVAKEYGVELLTTLAESELREAKYRGNPATGAKLLVLDDIDFADKAGRKQAVRDAIAELQEDSPELFRRTRSVSDVEDEEDAPRARRSPGSADLGPKRNRNTTLNPLEQAVNLITGSNGLV